MAELKIFCKKCDKMMLTFTKDLSNDKEREELLKIYKDGVLCDACTPPPATGPGDHWDDYD